MEWWLICYLFIQEADEPALECLEDITTTLTEKSPMGFSLHFHFKENEYFTNSVLTKEYHMKCEPMVRFIHFIFLKDLSQLFIIYLKRNLRIFIPKKTEVHNPVYLVGIPIFLVVNFTLLSYVQFFKIHFFH